MGLAQDLLYLCIPPIIFLLGPLHAQLGPSLGETSVILTGSKVCPRGLAAEFLTSSLVILAAYLSPSLGLCWLYHGADALERGLGYHGDPHVIFYFSPDQRQLGPFLGLWLPSSSFLISAPSMLPHGGET